MANLTFAALRKANLQRLPEFKNARGEPAHTEPDGSDWCLAQWMNALTGEVGEAANIIKKIDRGDMSLDEARKMLADELADIQTYLDIVAYQAGVDLCAATIEKWNRVSERVGARTRLTWEATLDKRIAALIELIEQHAQCKTDCPRCGHAIPCEDDDVVLLARDLMAEPAILEGDEA